jgi:5-methylcytosine-specific restriction endonuclease McrA
MLDYQTYISSPEWREKATEAKRRAGYSCVLCACTGSLEVHHRTYERLGNELPSDLVVLCWRCHRRHHGTFEECAERQLLLPMVPRGAELN